MKSLNSLSSSAQSMQPSNIFNFTNGNHLTAHFAYVLSLFLMLSVTASHILKRAFAHGGITQHYTMSLLNYNG